MEVQDMPNRMFHTIYINMLERLSTDAGQAEAAAEELTETLEGGN